MALDLARRRAVGRSHALGGDIDVQLGDPLGRGVAGPENHQRQSHDKGEEKHVAPVLFAKGANHKAGDQPAEHRADRVAGVVRAKGKTATLNRPPFGGVAHPHRLAPAGAEVDPHPQRHKGCQVATQRLEPAEKGNSRVPQHQRHLKPCPFPATAVAVAPHRTRYIQQGQSKHDHRSHGAPLISGQIEILGDGRPQTQHDLAIVGVENPDHPAHQQRHPGMPVDAAQRCFF